MKCIDHRIENKTAGDEIMTSSLRDIEDFEGLAPQNAARNVSDLMANGKSWSGWSGNVRAQMDLMAIATDPEVKDTPFQGLNSPIGRFRGGGQ